MGRAENTAVRVDNGNQDIKRQAAQLQNTELYGFRNNHQNMSGTQGIVLNTLENLEISIFFILQVFLPIAVAVVGIMVSDNHPPAAS